MRAVVQRAYGPPPEVLSVAEIDAPVPADDEVLVRVRAASLHPDVWHVVTGRPFALRLMGAGLRRPKRVVPGTDLAGRVEAVGARVTRFRVGDEVFGETMRGIQWVNGGAFAELAVAPEDALAAKPPRLSFEEAAAVPTSGIIALATLRARELTPGQRVLVNGAGGGVGIFLVQLAKARGAEVTAVDVAGKLDLLRRLGADQVLDAREDFTGSRERYDLVVDIPGNHPFRRIRRVLSPDGTYLLVGHDRYGRSGGRWLGSLPRVFRLMALSPFVRQLPRPDFSWPDKARALATLAAHIARGEVRPIVDRTFSLDEIVPAMGALAGGEARGKIVLTV